MKMIRLFSILLVVCGCMTVMVRATPADDQKNSAIQAIQQAPDPSAVVGAFANASGQFPNDPQLLSAYVSRMANLGLPEMVYHQAQTLTELQPDNGVAWAVVARVDVRRGLMPDAIAAGSKAAIEEPNSAFVQQTAGQLLAWYDVAGQQTSLPLGVQTDAERIRSQLAGTAAYIQGYNLTMEAYAAQSDMNQSDQTAQYQYPNQVTPGEQTEEQAYPTNAENYAENYPYNPSDYGYPYGGYGDNGGWGWGGGGWGGGWGGGGGWWWWPSFVFFPNDNFNHFHHFHHFHHRFDNRFHNKFDRHFDMHHNMHNNNMMHNNKNMGMHNNVHNMNMHNMAMHNMAMHNMRMHNMAMRGGMHGGMRGGMHGGGMHGGMHGGMGGAHGGMGGGGHGGGGGGGHR